MSDFFKGTEYNQVGESFTEGEAARTLSADKRDGTTKTIESNLSDAQAIGKLAMQLIDGGSDFARDLVVKHNQYGLSPKQWVWVHILAVEHEARAARTADAPVFSQVLAFMQAAKANLKYPKVAFTTDDDQAVQLSVAGDKARAPGSVNITDGGPWEENEYFGKINTNGVADLRDSCPDSVRQLIDDLNADAVGVIGERGRRSGSCCCCGKELTHEDSVAVGYGPTCASNFGLPYGNGATAEAVDAEPDAPGVERVHEDEVPNIADADSAEPGVASMEDESYANDEDVPF